MSYLENVTLDVAQSDHTKRLSYYIPGVARLNFNLVPNLKTIFHRGQHYWK